MQMTCSGSTCSCEPKPQRLADAIADAGHSPALLSRLAEVEANIADVERRVAAQKRMNLTVTIEEIRVFVQRNVLQLRDLLRQDAVQAKTALSRHVGQLVLKPIHMPTGPFYEVSGGVNLLAGQGVMPVVAREGIGKHYVPCFIVSLAGIRVNPAAKAV